MKQVRGIAFGWPVKLSMRMREQTKQQIKEHTDARVYAALSTMSAVATDTTAKQRNFTTP